MNITIEQFWGLYVARTEDTTGFRANYWFKPQGDVLRLVAEVIQFNNRRIYVDDDEMTVPPALEEHLLQEWTDVRW